MALRGDIAHTMATSGKPNVYLIIDINNSNTTLEIILESTFKYGESEYVALIV